MSKWLVEMQKIVAMKQKNELLESALSDFLDQMYAMQPMFEDDKDVSKAIKDAEAALNFIKKDE